MTVSFDGNGLVPFDEVTISTNAASGVIDICDDSNQNICLVTGTMGAATDASFTRFQLLDGSSNVIGNIKGNSGSVGYSSDTTQLASNVMAGNYGSMGNLNSDIFINGERMNLFIWIEASQNASQPFYDVSIKLFSTFIANTGDADQGHAGAYYQGPAIPRKLKFYMSTGNVSTASFKSYILGAN